MKSAIARFHNKGGSINSSSPLMPSTGINKPSKEWTVTYRRLDGFVDSYKVKNVSRGSVVANARRRNDCHTVLHVTEAK